MTLAELRAYVIAQLAAPVTLVSKVINVFNAVIDFITQSDNTGIPAWLSTLTFNTDGTGDGTFCTYLDDDGNLRFWKTKTDGNINNPPPTSVGVTENTYWIEVSPASGSAFKEWAPGLYGDGLIIVFFDVSGAGTDPAIYKLNVATRPFNSTNFEAELAAYQWTKLNGDLGGYSIKVPVDTTTAPIQWNINNSNHVIMVGSVAIAAAKTWQFINNTFAGRFTMIFELTGTPVQTLPSNVLMSDVRWDGTAKTWTPLEGGVYKAQGEYDGTNWIIDISPSFYE